jgi:hypothetical protein
VNRRRAFALAAAIVLVGALLALDARVTSSASLGFIPANARWTAHSADFPAFLEHVQETAAYHRVRAAASLPAENFWLNTRTATGIRPTPARFRHWLGHHLAAASTGDGFGICVRPGIVLRTASLFAGTSRELRLHTYGDYTYAWRDGFLIASKSRTYVQACLDASAETLRVSMPAASLTIEHRGDPKLAVTFDAKEGIPCRGRIERAFAKPQTALTLPGAWPEAPIVAVAGADATDVLDLLREILEDMPMTAYLNQTLDAMRDQLPEDLAREGGEFSLGLTGVDMTEELPIPELALLVRGETAGILPERPQNAVPIEWHGAPGWYRPWLGPKLAICAAAWERTRYLASQERLMPRIVRQLNDATPVDKHALVAVDWKRAAPIARDIILRAAERELIHRMNKSDVERQIVPYVEMIAALGAARLVGIVQDSATTFEGTLAAP